MRSWIVVVMAGALVAAFAGCTMGGGDDADGGETEPQPDAGETGPDVEALRAEWADAVNAACGSHGDRLAIVIRDLPGIAEQNGLDAGGARMAEAAEAPLAEMRQTEPAPGDEEQAASLADLYEEAWGLEAEALAAPYRTQDRRFARLMDDAEARREEADALAAELGADACANERAGPYAGRDGLAAVRWGLRVSELCRARDRAFRKLRATDIAGFDRLSAQFLAQVRTLPAPEPYAKRIAKFRKQYEEYVAASRRGDYERANDLSETSSGLMYDIGFDIGFVRFCSARPAG